MAAGGSATATGASTGNPWLAGAGVLVDVGQGIAGVRSDKDRREEDREWEAEQRQRDRTWRSGEAEKDRQFQREQRRRREQIYQQFINRQREGRLAWEQRRGAGLMAAQAMLPGIHGAQHADLSPLIMDYQARTAPGTPLTSPIVLPEETEVRGTTPQTTADPTKMVGPCGDGKMYVGQCPPAAELDLPPHIKQYAIERENCEASGGRWEKTKGSDYAGRCVSADSGGGYNYQGGYAGAAHNTGVR